MWQRAKEQSRAASSSSGGDAQAALLSSPSPPLAERHAATRIRAASSNAMPSSFVPLAGNRRVMTGGGGGGAHALEATLLAPFLGAPSAPAARPSYASQQSSSTSVVQRTPLAANVPAAAAALSLQPEASRKGSALPAAAAAPSGIGSSHSAASSPGAHVAAAIGSPVMPYSVVAAKSVVSPMQTSTPSPSSNSSVRAPAAAVGSASNSPQLSSTEVFPPLCAVAEVAASNSRRGSRSSPSIAAAGVSSGCSPSMPALELPRSSSPAGRPQWRTYRLSAFQAAELSSLTLPPAAAASPSAAAAAAATRSSALHSTDADDRKHSPVASAAASITHSQAVPVPLPPPLTLALDPALAMDDGPQPTAVSQSAVPGPALLSPMDAPVAVFYNDNRIHLVDHFTLSHFAHPEDEAAVEELECAADPRLLIHTIPADPRPDSAAGVGLPSRKFDSSPVRFLDSPLTVAVAPKNNSSPAFDFARDVIGARDAAQSYSAETMLQPSSYSTQVDGEEALDEWQDPGSAAHLSCSLTLTHSPRSMVNSFGRSLSSMALRSHAHGESMSDDQCEQLRDDDQVESSRLSYTHKAHDALRLIMGRAFGGEANPLASNPSTIDEDTLHCNAEDFEILSPE